MGLCLVWPRPSVLVTVHPGRKGSVWLCFSQHHAYSAQRVKHGDFPTFSRGVQIIFPALETGGRGTKTADCMPNASNLFLSKEILSEFSPRIVNRMAVTFFLFIYFSHLTGGTESVLHSSKSVLKSCLSYFLFSHPECQPVFYSEAALPI